MRNLVIALTLLLTGTSASPAQDLPSMAALGVSLRLPEWPEPLERAVLLPLKSAGREPAGFLLAGVSPRRPLDEAYRSFLNLAEGRVLCVMEAPNQDALAAWFKKMNMPCDYITPVELEGERGTVKNA